MLRKLLGAGAVLAVTLAGCREPKGACDTDADCGPGQSCNAEANLCFTVVTQFTGFEFIVPQGTEGAVKSGPVKLRARLVPPAGDATPNYPETIHAAVAPEGGAAVEVVLSHQGGGIYEGDWTAPAGEQIYQLTLSYPEAELTQSMSFRTDNTKPRFAVSVPQADAGVATATTTYADPQLPGAWRRDQVVSVSVTADEAVSASSVKVLVHGLDAGTAVEEFDVTPAGTCAGKFCGVATVDLSKPGMNAFRGSFAVEIQGADVAGNAAVVPDAGAIPVTRWKWAFKADDLETSPAISSQGSVIVADVSGTLIATHPDGTNDWVAAIGRARGSPAISKSSSGDELVFAAGEVQASATEQGVKLSAIKVSDGSVHAECTFTTDSSPYPKVTGASAVLNNGTGGGQFVLTDFGTAVTVNRSGGCREHKAEPSRNAPGQSNDGSLVVKGSRFFYPTNDSQLVAYDIGNAQELWMASSGTQIVTSLALAGDTFVGGAGLTFSQGGLYSGPEAGTAALTRRYPAANPDSRVSSVAVGGNGLVFFGRETASGVGRLSSVSLADGGSALADDVQGAGVFAASPVLGEGGFIYTTTRDGKLNAWSTGPLASRWFASGLGTILGTPNLDCARPSEGGAPIPGRPGVLYVPATDTAGDGRLYAIVVDSRGIDTTAPWPKYQHDPRNTGNADVNLSDFACP